MAQRLGTRLWIASNSVLSQVESAEGDVHRASEPAAGVFRVACFSPYATWDIVSAWELTVLRALARRGCNTRLLLCDAVSPTCDLVWADGNPNQQRCLVCQSRAAGAARLQHHPFEWMSRYVDAADRAAAIDWAAALPDDGLRHAQLGDDDLGEWCFGSMTSHFRGPRLDLDDPGVRRVYRQYLCGAAQTLAGCRAWLEAVQPDVLWLFNGRLALTRVALEAARGLGIRVICHERGMVRHSLRLWENERCSQYRGRREAALANARQPLTAQQAGQVLRWLDDRRHSRNYNRQPFLRKHRPSAAQSLAAAGVSAGDRILLALTSSDQEFGAEADRNQIFAEQHEWLMAILGWATRNPGCHLVIRFHPNASPASWAALAERLPELHGADETASVVRPRANVSVVPPGNPLDTYALLDACHAVTTYGSTTGIEAAAAGKTVVVADHCLYHGLPWAQSAESPVHFVELLDGMAWSARPQANPDVAAGAMRFFWDYHLGQSITSRLVRHPGLDFARITYRADQPERLDYGKDQGLDRITDVIMNRRAIYDSRFCGDAEAEHAAVIAHLKAAVLERRMAR
ncbi:MAG: hypothetical protein KFB97_15845 [Cyanobium sp. M30B3]|nr:MAG: hypothetical protein KFB97_15845 [Cyanobium sp. M30B3]